MLSTAIVTFLIICAVAMLSFARRRREPESEFLWRPESIRASVLRNDFFGQFLNLDRGPVLDIHQFLDRFHRLSRPRSAPKLVALLHGLRT
jgi:hypothetical protein